MKVFYARAGIGTGFSDQLASSGLTMDASCSVTNQLTVRARTDESDSSLKWAARDVTGTAVEGEDDNFDIGENVTVLSNQDNVQGTLSYASPSGDVVALTFQAEQGTDVLGGPGASQCLFSGQALGGP